MHELGLVFHCIKEVNEIAASNRVSRINSVTLQIGEVSTIINEYFEDCWKWAIKKEPLLKDSTLKIEKIDALTFCEDCKKEYPTVKYGKTCPYCGGPHTYLVTGNELLIKEIEVYDGPEEEEQTKEQENEKEKE